MNRRERKNEFIYIITFIISFASPQNCWSIEDLHFIHPNGSFDNQCNYSENINCPVSESMKENVRKIFESVFVDSTVRSNTFMPVNKLFFSKLESAIKIIFQDSKRATSSPLIRTYDQGQLSKSQKIFLEENFKRCALVQIAVRYSHIDSTGNLNWAFVDIDTELLKLIRKSGEPYENILNKVFIYLHEAVYLLSMDSNAESSRKLVQFLLNDQLWREVENKHYETAGLWLNIYLDSLMMTDLLKFGSYPKEIQ